EGVTRCGLGDTVDRGIVPAEIVVTGIGDVEAIAGGAGAERDPFPVPILRAVDPDAGVNGTGGIDGEDDGLVPGIVVQPEDPRIPAAQGHTARLSEFGWEPACASWRGAGAVGLRDITPDLVLPIW